MTLLEVKDLSIEYATEAGQLKAVDEVNLTIAEGETLGLAGESGSGKSTVAKSLLGLLDTNARVTNGKILFDGNNLADYSESEFRSVRWSRISFIAQNAMNALDPVYIAGRQIMEVYDYHTDLQKSAKRERTMKLLNDVGLDESVFYDYPHELSGGQRQRVIIALALALDPDLIIADEPTTGLDVVVQDAILELITNVQDETGSSMLLITHDMSAVAETADKVSIMYGGRVVETGPISDVFKVSNHPYTMGLRNAFPSLSVSQELVSIPGQPPDLINPPTGCIFKDRCPFATKECEMKPPMVDLGDGHLARCHYTDKAKELRNESRQAATWITQ